MPGPLHVTDSVFIPEAELNWRFSRSSGPGGQGVNTTDSRVELSVDVAHTDALSRLQRERALQRLRNRLADGVLTVAASQHRAQRRNRQAARDRMAELLREAIAPPPAPRRPTKPGKRAQQRRIDAKRRRGELKRGRKSRDD